MHLHRLRPDVLSARAWREYLFVPLAEAVIFAMLASYVLSRTLVPTMAMYLLDREARVPRGGRTSGSAGLVPALSSARSSGGSSAFRGALQRRAGARSSARPQAFAAGFLAFCVASLGARRRASAGTSSRRSTRARSACTCARAPACASRRRRAWPTGSTPSSARRSRPATWSTILDNIGLPYSGINLSYSNAGTIGTSDAEILVQLSAERARRRRASTSAAARRCSPERFPGVQFFFQPADIVSQILNFGTPAPIDVADHRQQPARRIRVGAEAGRTRSGTFPGAVDVHVQQAFDAPTLQHGHRSDSRAQSVGMKARDVAQNVLVSLSSSFQTAPSFWLDPQNGVSYSVAVQTPQYRLDSLQALENTPIGAARRGAAPQILGNLVDDLDDRAAAEVSHYNAQPMINVYASADGRDLGARRRRGGGDRSPPIEKDLPARQPHRHPRAGRDDDVVVRGPRLRPASGAIVLAYLLIVVNFQSWLDPFIIITALPGRARRHRAGCCS